MEQCPWVTCLTTFIIIATCWERIQGNPDVLFTTGDEIKCDSNKACVTFTRCDTFNGSWPRNCGWSGKEQMICCPVKKLKSNDNISACATYDNRRTKRVVGGQNAKRGSWPWMAAIFNQENSSRNTPIGGGSLISTSSVLTVANIFLYTAESNKFVVILGDLILGDDSDGLIPIEIEVSRIISHENYKYPEVYNDIAILKLKTAVVFTPNIRMICIPGLTMRNVNLDGKNATITGWGTTQFAGSPSPALQEASVPIVTNSQCEEAYRHVSTADSLPNGITKNIICAGGVKDSCQGDSGIPLAYKHENGKVWILVGIVSSGFECGRGIPGIYTRVSEYIDWIELHI